MCFTKPALAVELPPAFDEHLGVGTIASPYRSTNNIAPPGNKSIHQMSSTYPFADRYIPAPTSVARS